MSEQTVGVVDAASPTKLMRTIQQTISGQAEQSEVIVLATGAANGADTYDARQIRTLTSADIVTAILQSAVFKANNAAPAAAELALEVKLASVGSALITTTLPVSGTVTANQGTPNTVANAWPEKVTDGTNTASVQPALGFSNNTGAGIVVYFGDIPAVNINAGSSIAISGTDSVSTSNIFTSILENTSPFPAGYFGLVNWGFKANANNPSWTEAKYVPGSVDLAGNIRVRDPNLPKLATDSLNNLQVTNQNIPALDTWAGGIPQALSGAPWATVGW